MVRISRSDFMYDTLFFFLSNFFEMTFMAYSWSLSWFRTTMTLPNAPSPTNLSSSKCCGPIFTLTVAVVVVVVVVVIVAAGRMAVSASTSSPAAGVSTCAGDKSSQFTPSMLTDFTNSAIGKISSSAVVSGGTDDVVRMSHDESIVATDICIGAAIWCVFWTRRTQRSPAGERGDGQLRPTTRTSHDARGHSSRCHTVSQCHVRSRQRGGDGKINATS